jgi:hypothetical protein
MTTCAGGPPSYTPAAQDGQTSVTLSAASTLPEVALAVGSSFNESASADYDEFLREVARAPGEGERDE